MRTVKNPEDRKQEIVEGAIKVFAEKGYEKTSISDIAKALGISQGLCYRYFASKEEIYDATLDEYADHIIEEDRKNKNGISGIKEWIDAITSDEHSFTKTERDDENMYKMFHSEGSKKLHDDLFFRVIKKLVPIITAILEEEKAKGSIDIVDCRATAIMGLYGEMGLFMCEDMDSSTRMKSIRESWYRLLGIE